MSTALTTSKNANPAGEEHAVPEGGLYCSLCWGESYEGEEKIDDMFLCKCRDCGTLYHNECYRNYSFFAKEVAHKKSIASITKKGNKNGGEASSKAEGALEKRVFVDHKTGVKTTVILDTCIACASVNKAIKGRTRRGKKHTVEVTTRPYECCLCSVDSPDLPLPMHPIYDRNNGRQLLLEKGSGGATTYRPAWCHTLCARVIGSSPPTGGCVYSCDPRGKYYGFEGDDDDRSMSSEVEVARKNERIDREYGVHHYCIVLSAAWKQYTKAIKTAQKFTCLVCGKDDKPANVYRIPVAVSITTAWCCLNDAWRRRLRGYFAFICIFKYLKLTFSLTLSFPCLIIISYLYPSVYLQ